MNSVNLSWKTAGGRNVDVSAAGREHLVRHQDQNSVTTACGMTLPKAIIKRSDRNVNCPDCRKGY